MQYPEPLSPANRKLLLLSSVNQWSVCWSHTDDMSVAADLHRFKTIVAIATGAGARNHNAFDGVIGVVNAGFGIIDQLFGISLHLQWYKTNRKRFRCRCRPKCSPDSAKPYPQLCAEPDNNQLLIEWMKLNKFYFEIKLKILWFVCNRENYRNDCKNFWLLTHDFKNFLSFVDN